MAGCLATTRVASLLLWQERGVSCALNPPRFAHNPHLAFVTLPRSHILRGGAHQREVQRLLASTILPFVRGLRHLRRPVFLPGRPM